MSIWVIFKLLGSLALLMFGMKSMSEALQKMAGLSKGGFTTPKNFP